MTQTRTIVILAPEDGFLLARLATARSTPAAVAVRARVLVARDFGLSLAACAKSAGCGLSTVKRICHRFQTGGLEALYEAPRSGAPPSYSEETQAFFCTLVRQAPQHAGLPLSRWSLHWLRVVAQRAGWSRVPSRERIRRWLHAAHLPWLRHRSWETSNDARFWEKLERLRELYENDDPNLLVLACDEKPQIQALARRLPDRYPRPGYPRLRQHEYVRHGTVNLFAIQRLRDGHISCSFYRRGTALALGRLLARYLRRQPEARVAVILDNASSHLSARFLKAAQKSGKQIELAFTPTYSSWSNSAEWFFNHLQRDLLRLSSVPSGRALIARIRAYRELYLTHRAAPVRMPGLAHYLGRIRTSEARH
jgi:transposase